MPTLPALANAKPANNEAAATQEPARYPVPAFLAGRKTEEFVLGLQILILKMRKWTMRTKATPWTYSVMRRAVKNKEMRIHWSQGQFSLDTKEKPVKGEQKMKRFPNPKPTKAQLLAEPITHQLYFMAKEDFHRPKLTGKNPQQTPRTPHPGRVAAHSRRSLNLPVLPSITARLLPHRHRKNLIARDEE